MSRLVDEFPLTDLLLTMRLAFFARECARARADRGDRRLVVAVVVGAATGVAVTATEECAFPTVVAPVAEQWEEGEELREADV